MRTLTEEHIFNQTTRRLDLFLQHGVTTLESKSGYGLDLENELKQLRVMQRLQKSTQWTLCQPLWEHMQYRKNIETTQSSLLI